MRKAVIYYFSASGNSLVAARALARGLDGQLVSIPSVMDQVRICPDTDAMGIVFPVYYATNDNGGVPLIVRRFIDKLDGIGQKYLFAVCTHSGGPGTTIENARDMIAARGGKLAAGFTVKMAVPPAAIKKIKDAVLYKELRKTDTPGDQGRYQQAYADAAKKLDAICEYVNAGKTGMFETSSALQKLVNVPLLLLTKPVFTSRYRQLSGSTGRSFRELIHGADRSFTCSEKCHGCGTCARVCPVGNIEMVDRKPVWQHRCETCFACYVWCPNGAIGGPIVAYNERHHHPDVRLADMVKN